MKKPVLVVATRNAHKVQEIRQILGAACRVLDLADFPGSPPVVEDADTFEGNARKKSESLAGWLVTQKNAADLPDFALADDSGLEVDALRGAPGVHSARFAAAEKHSAGNTPDADNNAKLLLLLRHVPLAQRTGRFRCVLALTSLGNGSTTAFFAGECPGRISAIASGAGGFGYDPLFVPDGFTQSFAELGESIKNGISHRARALEKLRAFLSREFS